ncbi:MAG: NAD(+) diphosphatase, partial [bacterium]|nr:NAD(+) diphosphatase [bacterium]
AEDPRAWPRPSSAQVPMVTDPTQLGLSPQSALYLGRLGECRCFAATVEEDTTAPSGHDWYGLRALFSVLDDDAFSLAGRALQLVDWDISHRFCSQCAAPTQPSTTDRSRVCPECNLVAFPRLAPAVMIQIRRLPNEILLARSAHFPTGMYSSLAGFVEPGETLEQTIDREVLEEVGVRVTNLRYFASQPWPFPHSMMIAFVADWESGDINIDNDEITSAEWFSIDNLPIIPSPISIARKLVDAVVKEMSEEC